jgi:hypothetical protein
MHYLRQNTATRVTVGPFIDKTDGVTPEVALTATNEKITFMVDTGGVPTLVIDANATASGGNNDFVHVTGDDAGYYDLELTAAQTNYVGRARLAITYATDHLPVFHEYFLLPANVYDAWTGAANLQVDAVKVGGTTQTARDLGASVLLSSGTGTGQVSLSSGKVDIVTTAINSIADQVWDEALSGHVAAGSAGAMLFTPNSGTATAATSTTLQLAVGASATNDFYKDSILVIVAGTGVGQARAISSYTGASRTATVPTWAVTPSTDSVYVVVPSAPATGAVAPTAAEVADAVWEELVADHDQVSGSTAEYMKGLVLRSGTLQSGSTTSSIILDTGASTTNDVYNRAGLVVWDTGNLQNIQSSQITDYVGATRTATVDPPFAVAPSTTSYRYAIVPLGIDAATTTAIASAVWAATRSGNNTAGTFGEYVNADATRISGSATPADQLEAIYTGAGTIVANITGNITGNVTGSVGSVTGAVGSVTGDVGGNVTGSVGSVTGGVTVTTNNDKTGYALSNTGIDALFTRQLTEAYAADGVAPTVAQALMLIQQSIGDFSISGTTLTVKKLDGTTTAATYTLDDANNPVSRTRAT